LFEHTFLKNGKDKNKKWIFIVEASFGGACAIAAARHALNFGIEAKAYLYSADIDSCSEFAELFEVFGCMSGFVGMWDERLIDKLDENTISVVGANVSASNRSKLHNIVEPSTFESKDAWNNEQLSVEEDIFITPPLPATPLFSCKEIRTIDSIAIEEYGLSGMCLMENAGISATRIAINMCPGKDSKIVIITGKGNNGGDGFVVARGLVECGYTNVKLAMLCAPRKLRGDAEDNYEILEDAGFELIDVSSSPEGLGSLLNGAELLIDAILGTGIKGQVKDVFAEAIGIINKSSSNKLALDIPSGLDGDTGKPLGIATKADVTITFAGMKQGFAKKDAQQYCGDIYIADIGAPAGIMEEI
jgi:NAD(P)H-hydrate epimerase